MLDYQTLTIEDIIEWCKENNQVQWLKDIAKKEVKVKRHTGKIAVEINGKIVNKVDRKSPIVETKEKITYFQIKKAFAEKFMPEILPTKKASKKSMYDIIADL